MNQTWVRERGPEDAAPPPAEPIDNGAVQTYYLDPQNGRWSPTILGLQARHLSGTLKEGYRSAYVAGLAIAPPKPKAGSVPDDAGSSRGMLRVVAAVLVLVTLIGGGAVAANSFLGSNNDAAATDAPGVVAPSGAVVNPDPAATGATASTPATTASPSTAATQAPAPTAPPAATPVRTQAPVRTAAPTVPPVAPITIISYTTRLANGVTITFTGPNAVVQGTGFDATFRAVDAKGLPAHDNLVMYFGQLGSAQTVAITGDANGTYTTSIRVNSPKGDQQLSIRFGNNGELRTMGTISVR